MQKINSENMKQSNTTLILQVIAQDRSISRADISRKTGLNKATVSEITKELINKKQVIETGDSKQTGGRKAKILTFNKSAATLFAIDFEIDCMVAVITDLYGNFIYKKQTKVISKNYDDNIKLLYRVIDDLLENNPETPFGVMGLALSVRGLVAKDGVLKYMPYYEWNNVDIKKLIEGAYNIPTTIGNDADLFAVGENLLGHNAENFLGINISSGVGLGAVINGEIYRGADGFAGEIGHMIVEPSGKKCTCGNAGCLEQYVSEQAIVRDISIAKDKEQNIDDFIELVNQEDEEAQKIYSDFIYYMAIALNNVANLFNPYAVVIYSEIFSKLPKTVNLVEKSINSKVFNTKIIVAKQNRGDVILLGAVMTNVAARLGVQNVLSRPFVEM